MTAEMVVDLRRIKTELIGFLEILKMYTGEEDNGLLGHIWEEPNHKGMLLNGIYMVTTLRTENPEVWERCEPVVRAFWERFAGRMFFRDRDDVTRLAREITYRNWFGEDEETRQRS